MTNPFGISKWEEQGWRPPTPHQVLSFIMFVASIGAVIAAFTGPVWLVAALVAVTGGSGGAGIASAKNHLSPQILAKLQAIDARGMEPTPATVINTAGGDVVADSNPMRLDPEELDVLTRYRATRDASLAAKRGTL